MTNQIIEAISTALDAEFEGYEIHMEEIKQGLKEPCFFIVSLNPTTELFLGKRYFKTNHFCIQFFPETAKKQWECNDVAERLLWSLEYVTLNGSPIHGTSMKYEVVAGVLNFFVNYDFFIYRTEEKTAMGSMESGIRVKEGD